MQLPGRQRIRTGRGVGAEVCAGPHDPKIQVREKRDLNRQYLSFSHLAISFFLLLFFSPFLLFSFFHSFPFLCIFFFLLLQYFLSLSFSLALPLLLRTFFILLFLMRGALSFLGGRGRRRREEEKWKKKSPNWCFVFVLVNSNMVRPLKRPAVSAGPISGAR